MSLGARASKGGAKGKQDKGKPADKPPKEKVKPQATTEQLRMAHMIDRKSEDASDVRRMVLELMEMTRRTEEEVCSALHDSDNDMQAACNLLLEETQRIQGEWQTSEKKKKKPPAPAGNGDVEPPRDPRSRSGPRTRREGVGRGAGGEGGRGRGARGAGGARGGRGAGGARGGRRGAPQRGLPRHNAHYADQPPGTMGDSFPTTEDWDNEEWSGSLSDTKVFTPSANAQNCAPETDPTNQNSTEDWGETGEPNGPADLIPTYTYHNNHHTLIDPVAAAPPADTPPAPETYLPTIHHQPMGMSGSLSAAQSQYLSQLTQQSQRQENNAYTTGYGVYGSDMASQRKPQRARVPPPSKIPSSAVEMPGGSEASGAMFLDVQFGALEPDTLQDTKQPAAPEPAASPLPERVPSPVYVAPTILPESLSVVEPVVTSQPVVTEPPVTNTTSSLEKQLTASMKQLGVGDPPPATTHHHRAKTHPTTVAQPNVYAHHAVSHHPPYANVYAPQVNSTSASISAASLSAAQYPSSVALTQYQPIINSYQVGAAQAATSSSAAAYGGSALYTAAPYSGSPYQPSPPHHAKIQQKEPAQYDNSVASSNCLTSTTTAQTSTAKVVTTTAGHVSSVAGVTSSSVNAAGGPGYAGALYGAQGTGAYAYDEAQIMRGTMHHMGGYYEVGYGGREGAFGLSAGERFGRTDAASPQQVPPAALPPGYAYFAYQPPPTTYQYGVYPTYGGGSNVGGVGSVSAAAGKVSSYGQQQPPYDQQDSYKPGGPYTGNANKSGAAATADLTNAMYAKTHVALNKVNSYEKAAFHSGTPPPFGATSHLYIPAPPHHHPHHHPPQQHQMDARVNISHRRESASGGGRSAASKPANSKPNYSQSYWAPN